MGASNRHFFANQLIVMAISFGISIVISIIIPFPISLAVIVGVFILLNFYMRNRIMRKMGMGTAGRGIFNSMSSSGAGSSADQVFFLVLSWKHQFVENVCKKRNP